MRTWIFVAFVTPGSNHERLRHFRVVHVKLAGSLSSEHSSELRYRKKTLTHKQCFFLSRIIG